MDDEREEELGSISAIYSELVVDPQHPLHASIDVTVAPIDPVSVSFAASDISTPPPSEDGQEHSCLLSFFPSLHVDIYLPPAYPAAEPPQIKLSTSPPWLPPDKLLELEAQCAGLWQDYGRCQTLFGYLDHLQQASERLFDLPSSPLTLSPALQARLVNFDTQSKKQAFEASTFDCGVCLEPKKGSVCYRLEPCYHVFCRSCLKDFYTNAIAEGDVANIRCLDPDCAKDGTRRERKTLHPRDLLKMGIPEPTARRYVEMKRKKKMESNKATVYCPRKWCQAPARGDAHPPVPADLTEYPDSEEDDQPPPEPPLPAAMPATQSDRLQICSKCTFAFCKTCCAGWHGELARCYPRDPKELSVEEQASYDYLRLHTSICPTCSSPTQKTLGCNHMICYQCKTHFCYLCGAWLMPDNPYMHFNTKRSTCFNRLWELEEGDDGHGQVQFAGARRLEADAAAAAELAQREQDEVDLQQQQQQRDLVVDDLMEEDDFAFFIEAAMPEADAQVPDPVQEGAFELLARDMRNVQVDRVEPEPVAAILDQNEPNRRGRGTGRRRRGGRQAGHLPNQGDLQQNQRQPADRGRGAGGGRGNGRGRGLGPLPQQRQGRVRAAQNGRQQVVGPARAEAGYDDAHEAAFRRFVEMAQRDQEDEWNSDELEDEDEMWRIR